MPLSTRLAFQFDKRVQIKGAAFTGKSITVIDSSPTSVHAEVKDNKPYSVRLVYEDGKLLVSCGCPYYMDHGQCMHLWAVVLEADRRNALQEALKARYLEIEDDLDEDDLDEDNDEDDSFTTTGFTYYNEHRGPRY